MHQALNSVSRPKSVVGRTKPTLVYVDYFKCVHKMEPGKNIRHWGELYVSCIWICRFSEKVFKNISKNIKASTVHTMPDVQQFPLPGVPPVVMRALAGLALS